MKQIILPSSYPHIEEMYILVQKKPRSYRGSFWGLVNEPTTHVRGNNSEFWFWGMPRILCEVSVVKT